MTAPHPEAALSAREAEKTADPRDRYYGENGAVWKAPIETRKENGTTSISIGFKVCTMTDVVGPEAADTVADLMNAGVAALAQAPAVQAPAGEGSPIDTAPLGQEVRIQAGEMTFLAKLVPGAGMNMDETTCDQWQATREGEHPECWSEGACYASNADEVASLQPTRWWPVGTPTDAQPKAARPVGDERLQVAKILAHAGLGTATGDCRRIPENWEASEWENRILEVIPERCEQMCFDAADKIISCLARGVAYAVGEDVGQDRDDENPYLCLARGIEDGLRARGYVTLDKSDWDLVTAALRFAAHPTTGQETVATPRDGGVREALAEGDARCADWTAQARQNFRNALSGAALSAPRSSGPGEATDRLVDRFADALKDRLGLSKHKPGRGDFWMRADWQSDCQIELSRHVAKGDPLDVAAYAAFCWHHGWPTATPSPAQEPGTGDTGEPYPIPSQEELSRKMRENPKAYGAGESASNDRDKWS